jgi:uncharacterized membrane protein YkoI
MKKKMALALITVLSISALTLSVFADTPVIRGNSESSVQETQTEQEQSEGKSSGNSIDEKSSDSETGEKTDDCRGHGKFRGRPDEEQVEEPENAIGKDAAESKALNDAGVSEDQAGRVVSHLSQLDDGTVVYRVDFICNDQHYSYQVNATSGEIVEKKNEAVSEDRMAGPGGHGRPDEEQVEEPENAIGKDAAESKALNDAGVSEDQAGRVMSHLSQLDDGTVVYRVDFICSDQHYSYQVNATSGEIIEKKNEAVSEDRMAGPGGRRDRENNSATADSFTETASDVA